MPLIERAIGGLLKKHSEDSRFYQLSHDGGVLRVERDDARLEAAVELCGDYVLKTDHSLAGPGLWKLYMTLLRAEEGFNALKGTLGLRPNFHQLEGRVEGHIFISILACHLLCWVGHRLTASGDAATALEVGLVFQPSLQVGHELDFVEEQDGLDAAYVGDEELAEQA